MIDYAQGELKVVACFAPEKTMIQAYLDGLDLHAVTGAKLAGVDFKEFLTWKDHTDTALVALYDKHRSDAKPANFGLLYGQTAKGFMNYCWKAYGIRLTLEEAEKMRDAFFSLYPGLLGFHTRQVNLVKQWHEVRSPLGRVRHLPTIKSTSWKISSKAERQAINCLSDDTQILTVRGWRAVDEIAIGDLAVSVNPKDGAMELCPIDAIHVGEVKDAQMWQIEHSSVKGPGEVASTLTLNLNYDIFHSSDQQRGHAVNRLLARHLANLPTSGQELLSVTGQLLSDMERCLRLLELNTSAESLLSDQKLRVRDTIVQVYEALARQLEYSKELIIESETDIPDEKDPGVRATRFFKYIQAAVADLDTPPYDNIKRFLIHVAWHEGGRLTSRIQKTKKNGKIVDGPARSFYQFEANRAKDAVLYANKKKLIGKLATVSGSTGKELVNEANKIDDKDHYFPDGNLIKSLLETNDAFGTYLARIAFKKIQAAIDKTNQDHADYWFSYWKVTSDDPDKLKKIFVQEANEVDLLIEQLIKQFQFKINKKDWFLRRKSGNMWQQINDSGNPNHNYYERSTDGTYIYMDDDKQGVVELKFLSQAEMGLNVTIAWAITPYTNMTYSRNIKETARAVPPASDTARASPPCPAMACWPVRRGIGVNLLGALLLVGDPIRHLSSPLLSRSKGPCLLRRPPPWRHSSHSPSRPRVTKENDRF